MKKFTFHGFHVIEPNCSVIRRKTLNAMPKRILRLMLEQKCEVKAKIRTKKVKLFLLL